jgi:hypothetical protein
MATIAPFLRAEAGSFNPTDVKAMSKALDDICREFSVPVGASAVREAIAVRVIELAQRGERSPTCLRDRVVSETCRMADLDERRY